MDALTATQSHTLTTCDPNPTDRNPAAVYLAGLAQGSRRTMREALDTLARILTNGQADAFSVDWAALRFQHTAAIRSRLAERYAPRWQTRCYLSTLVSTDRSEFGKLIR